MKVLWLKLLPVVFALFAFAGCSSVPRLEDIIVRPTAVEVTDSGLALTMHFANPNVIPIGISHSTHRIILSDSDLGQINNETPVGLPALGGQDLKLTVTLSAAQRAKFSPGSQVSYRINNLLIALSREDELEIKSASQGTVRIGAKD